LLTSLAMIELSVMSVPVTAAVTKWSRP
jgi:hypothetical protein